MQNKAVNLGLIGLGARAETLLVSLFGTRDVEVVAVCDLSAVAITKIKGIFAQNGRPAPADYQNHHDLLARDDVEAVIISTSWISHLPIATAAMKAGKYAAIEVGGASSTEELWQLVHASEQTGMPCMMLENICYARLELMIFNMVRQGLFGEIVHCEGGYEHEMRAHLVGGLDRGLERSLHNRCRNADLYPTHQLGPIAKILGINRGNRFLSLTSTASKARSLAGYARAHGVGDIVFNNGDVVTTVIKCAGGETIALTRSVTLPRPYSRHGRVQGTKGLWLEDANGIFIDGVSRTIEEIDAAGNPYTTHLWDAVESYSDRYEHPLWRDYKQNTIGGHAGADWLAIQAFLDAVRKKTTTPIDVYDCAAWMSVTCLSEQSIALGSMPVAFPDFTNGKWMKRQPAPVSKWALDAVHEECFR
ncbi:MAG: Alpha-N-acetylgalactosaminidase [Verrucomicrobiae bacterium]|nr:Alpha-N-acetylgalactosaminidase [Verrucomicrobiae bacterium]